MTTATETGQGLEPLWSDNDIIAAYRKAFGRGLDVHIYALMRWMRDDLTAERAKTHATIAAQTQRIATLEAELAEAKKWVPKLDYQSGALSFVQPLIDTANAPGEDEAWEHLQGGGQDG